MLALTDHPLSMEAEIYLLATLLFITILAVGGLLIQILRQLQEAIKVLHGEVLELSERIVALDESLDGEDDGDSSLEKYLREDVAFYRAKVLGGWPPPDHGGVTQPGVGMGVLASGVRPSASPFHVVPGKSLIDGFTTDPPPSLPMDPIDMSGGFEGPIGLGPAQGMRPPSPRLVPPPKVLSPEVPPPGATSSSSSPELDQMVQLLNEWPETKHFDPAKR